jgi:hypothetical protein
MCPGADGGAADAGVVEASRGAGKTTRLEARRQDRRSANSPFAGGENKWERGRKMRQSEKESGK